MFATRLSLRVINPPQTFLRGVSTLSSNPHIKAFPLPYAHDTHILTYLDREPPSENLSVGKTTELPPTPKSFSENPRFVEILNDVLRQHAKNDEYLIAQARAFAGPGGATLGSGGAFFSSANNRGKRKTTSAGLGGGGGAGGGGTGGASAQGGAGGGGMGGYVHLSDARNPPDYGRIAWPEDILGSVEVDSTGAIIGRFEPSGTYRLVTNEGVLGLSTFLRTKLIERLKEEEAKE